VQGLVLTLQTPRASAAKLETRKGCRTWGITLANAIEPAPSAWCSKLGNAIQKPRENQIKDKPGTLEEEESQCHRNPTRTVSYPKQLGSSDFQTHSIQNSGYRKTSLLLDCGLAGNVLWSWVFPFGLAQTRCWPRDGA